MPQTDSEKIDEILKLVRQLVPEEEIPEEPGNPIATFGGLQELPKESYKEIYKLANPLSGPFAEAFSNFGSGTYQATATVKLNKVAEGQTGTRGYRLSVEGSPWPWKAGRFSSNLVKGSGEFNLVTRGVLTDPTRLVLYVENYSNAIGEIEITELKLVKVDKPPISYFVKYPNYRGEVSSGAIILDVEGEGVITLEDNKGVILDKAIITEDGTAALRTDLLTTEYSLIKARSGDYEAPAFAVKLGKPPIDSSNRFLKDGVPYIPVGVYDSGLGYTGTADAFKKMLTERRRLYELNPDIYLNYHYGQAPATSINALMDAVPGMVFQGANCFADCVNYDLFESSNSVRNPEFMDSVSKHKNWGGVYLADEAKETRIPNVWPAATYCRRWPGFNLGVFLPNNSVGAWRDVMDVIGVDPYPIAGGDADLNKVPQAVAAAREAVKNSRPIIAVIQFFKQTSLGRWPTKEELEYMALSAIAEGANGILFWSIGNGTGALFAGTAECPNSTEWCPERNKNFENLKAAFETIRKVPAEPGLILDDNNVRKAVQVANAVITYSKVAPFNYTLTT